MIKSFEQYDAALCLLQLLENLKIASADDAETNFVAEYAEEWELCDDCEMNLDNCECDAEHDDYDDEDHWGCNCSDEHGCHC